MKEFTALFSSKMVFYRFSVWIVTRTIGCDLSKNDSPSIRQAASIEVSIILALLLISNDFENLPFIIGTVKNSWKKNRRFIKASKVKIGRKLMQALATN